MVNYYEEFGLNPDMSGDEICAALFQEKKKWIHRQNANDLNKRQLAEQKIALIEEAAVIFSDKLKRDQYDLKILKEKKKAGGKKQQDGRQEAAPQQYGGQEAAPQQYGQGGEAQAGGGEAYDADIETIVANATAYYESGNSDNTITYCSNMIGRGADSPYLFYYLGLAYWENDNVQEAVSTFLKAIERYPQEPLFCGNLASVMMNANNDYASAKPYIDKALSMDPNNSYYLGLEITYMFCTGDVDAAEAKIRQHLEEYPDDQEYREQISEVYISYSDKFLVECPNGGAYIPSQQAYDSILYYRNKAKDILPTARTENTAAVIEERGKRTFNKDNLKGIIGLVVLGSLFLWPLLPLWLICAGVLAYFSYKPNWLIEKMALTNQRDLANMICHYLYVACSYVYRLFIWCLKLMFYIFANF